MRQNAKNARFVLNRWVDKQGVGAIINCFIYMGIKLLNAVFKVILASRIILILEQGLSPKKALMQILAVISFYVFLFVSENFYKLKRLISTFLYRLSESPDVFSKLMRIPYSEVEGSVGKQEFEKASKAIANGVDIGVEVIIKSLSDLVVSILCLIVFMLISARLNPLITLLLLITGYVRTFKDKNNRKWLLNTQDYYSSLFYERHYLNRQCLDAKIGKDARIYSMDKWFSEKYSNIVSRIMAHLKTQTKNKFIAESIQFTTAVIRDIVCYGYLIYKVSQGMAISNFVLYLGVISSFNIWIKNIFTQYVQFSENIIIVNNLRVFLDKRELGEGNYELDIKESSKYEYVFENVCFSYGDTDIIKNLNLTINAGEKIALVGENGAGKSTLVKLMCGLYQPQKGRILLNGIDISKTNPKRLLKITGVVFQQSKVFPESIARNVSCKVSEEINYAKVADSLKQAGLYDYVQTLSNKEQTILTKSLDDTGIELSGGQYQKLMLARAIYKNAPILILDEPTSALDPLAEAEMYRKYNELTHGKTSIFVSHRLSSTQFCDRVLYLKNGIITQDGSHDDLMKQKGEYREMFNAQAHYYQKEVATCKL